jgi:integrase
MTQLRPGELSALRWDALDLDSGMLHVRAIRSTDVNGIVITKDKSKSRAGTRSFPLPDICVQKLRAHRVRQNEVKLRMPPGTWTDRGLVFPGRAGRIMTQAAQSWRVTRLCEQSGVPVVTMHGLRHSGATWQLALGVDAKLISQRLGHASVTFTLDTYVHPSDDDQRGVSERIEADLLRRRG